MLRSTALKSPPASLTRAGVTRAHLALAQRPQLGAALSALPGQLAKLLGERLESPFTLEARLLDAAVRSPTALGAPAAFGLIALDAVGGFAILEVPGALGAALVDRLAGGPGEPMPPLPVTEAEEVGLSLLLLDALCGVRGSPLEEAFAPRLSKVVRRTSDVAAVADLGLPHLVLQLKVVCGPAEGLARLLVPASALRSWVSRSPPMPRPMLPEVASAELGFALCMGRARLTPADRASLQEGDVVLLDELARSEGALVGPARLRGTTFALTGSAAGPRFTVASLHLPEEPPMTARTQPMTAPELPIDVEVELCRIRMTLAELGGLQPGAVVPLKLTAGEPVLLKLGESTLAVVELVDIEGEIGARILRLSRRGTP